MKDNRKNVTILFVTVFFLVMVGGLFLNQSLGLKQNNRKIKLYWFIPDGVRAEPVTFKIYEWAKEGKLPNIKRLMEEGAYGYSIPVFPGHTPTNFATLLTGTTPDVHGIADGPMRMEGYPLSMVSKGGFSSQAKRVEPLWYTLEQEKMLVSLLSIPGSTPPELSDGITVRGRWGGWGIEFPAINFHSAGDEKLRVETGQNKRVFSFGSELTRFIKASAAQGWSLNVNSFSPPREIDLSNWNFALYALVIDSSDDQIENYDSVLFSRDKKNIFSRLREEEWSSWLPVTLSWELKNDYNINTPKKYKWESEASGVDVDTEVKIKIIKLGKKDYFRIRLVYSQLNEFLIKPGFYFSDIRKKVGPAVDFVDNYPPQLIYLPEDKDTFIQEMMMSFEWHKKMVTHMTNNWKSDVIIQSIYSPNQMLTSRWWMPFIDPESPRYNEVSEEERRRLWEEVLVMYQNTDKILGEIMNNSDPDTYIIFSSDHGAIPLYQEVRLNNLFAKKGWLKFHYNETSGEYEIDWAKTKVIFLQMDNVYIHTSGFGSNYYPDSGSEYEALRAEVIAELEKLKTSEGHKIALEITTREDLKKLHLPPDRSGDLVIANHSHYNWVEDVSPDLKIFKKSLKGGYKQAVLPAHEQGLWTPFMIKGPGIKAGVELKKPINHIDQYATILKLLKVKPTAHQKGRVLEEIMGN